jgi:hypothetical protein
VYVSENHIDAWFGGRRVGLEFHEDKTPGAELCLSFIGECLLDDLEIRDIDAGTPPDVRRYRAAIESIEPSKRVGRHILTHLKSPRPWKQVVVEFLHGESVEGKE